MQIQTQNNPCIRCGKQRIRVGTYKELLGNSIVTRTKTACPDVTCQAIVDRQLNKEKKQRERFAKINKNHSAGGRWRKKVNSA